MIPRSDNPHPSTINHRWIINFKFQTIKCICPPCLCAAPGTTVEGSAAGGHLRHALPVEAASRPSIGRAPRSPRTSGVGHVRIAQISPLYESVPPKSYGGTERVVSYLTEELVQQGHDVTLFASGDSKTSARLVGCSQRSLRLWQGSIDALAHHVLMLECVGRHAEEFDILHFHIDYLHFPFSRRAAWPNVTTLHGRLDIPDLQPLYDEFQDMPVVSISDDQRAPLPQRQLAGDGVPRPAARSLPAPRGARPVPGVSRPDFARKARGSGDRDCPPRRSAAPDRGQDRRRRP